MGCAILGLLVVGGMIAFFALESKRREQDLARLSLQTEERVREILARPAEPDVEVVPLRVFWYDGPVYFSLIRGRRLVALDVEIKHGGPWLKLDHMEILNGQTGRSYGDKPHIVYLTEDGTPLPDAASEPVSAKVRLVYQVPRTCSAVNLRLLTDDPLFPAPIQVQ